MPLVQGVVLARRAEDRHANGLQRLVGGVEFVGLGQVADVAGVQQEGRLGRHRPDMVDGRAKRRHGVGIGGLVEADVGVADLHERQTGGLACRRLRLAEQRRRRHTAGHGPDHARPGPGHAFQQTPAGHAAFARQGLVVIGTEHGRLAGLKGLILQTSGAAALFRAALFFVGRTRIDRGDRVGVGSPPARRGVHRPRHGRSGPEQGPLDARVA